MNAFHKALTLSAVFLLASCAVTPEQRAAREAAQKKYEQELQVALAAQCDKETASLMEQQFNPPVKQSEKERKEFRLRYVDKVADPMFQACYKLAWQNYISQQRLQRIYDYYDDWDSFYFPYRRPFCRYCW
ncbi:Uncharacterised protein [Neisseria animaloris]|uniref:hypothetical protein n=1 Tax=Neisseria animaloris TaxID=326522 RepID=UPI000A18E6CD|nr:hypothetical protein [Neisseria animaloris]MDO5073535.1 hypothetical protein [Neisseria animaloris]OSI08845.1 hypothetical protein BWD08_01665 [Neisseria animaloris]VEH87184.1 Uncharacterised protein [Neisseria animaloris]